VDVQQKPKIVNESKEVKHNFSLVEILIFKLSPVLGGRNEVLECPLSEAFTYFSLEQERTSNEKLESFLNLWFSNPMVDADKRKAYIQSITPKNLRTPIETKWDFDKLRKYKMSQKSG